MLRTVSAQCRGKAAASWRAPSPLARRCRWPPTARPRLARATGGGERGRHSRPLRRAQARCALEVTSQPFRPRRRRCSCRPWSGTSEGAGWTGGVIAGWCAPCQRHATFGLGTISQQAAPHRARRRRRVCSALQYGCRCPTRRGESAACPLCPRLCSCLRHLLRHPASRHLLLSSRGCPRQAQRQLPRLRAVVGRTRGRPLSAPAGT